MTDDNTEVVVQADNPDEVVVAGQTFVIGKPKPAQIAGIVSNFAKLNIKARALIGTIENPQDADYIMAFLANVDEATLIDLAALSIGADKKFVVENFDLLWVTRALSVLIRKANVGEVIANFTSILSPNQQ